MSGAALSPSRNLEAGQGPSEAGGEQWSICELEPPEKCFEEISLFDDTGKYSGYNMILNLIHSKFSAIKKKKHNNNI